MVKSKGTQEWSPRSLNCYFGCSNNCSYCYARRMAIRFNRIEGNGDWKNMRPNWKAINKTYRRVKKKDLGDGQYDYMFPTSHDITPISVDSCSIVLGKVLEAGNSVLITTKANYKCIDKLYEIVFAKPDKTPNEYKDQVEFRITITSSDDDILKKYETNAPRFESRLSSLSILNALDFKTSVSIEPYLSNPIKTILCIYEFVNNTIWIGVMSGSVPKELKHLYTKEYLEQLYNSLFLLPKKISHKIRLKDSVVNKLNLQNNIIEAY